MIDLVFFKINKNQESAKLLIIYFINFKLNYFKKHNLKFLDILIILVTFIFTINLDI